jgi:hypothetical protein
MPPSRPPRRQGSRSVAPARVDGSVLLVRDLPGGECGRDFRAEPGRGRSASISGWNFAASAHGTNCVSMSR